MPLAKLMCNTYQANSLKTSHTAITQANMNTYTGHFIYAFLKILIVGQKLLYSDCLGCNKQTNSIENKSLMFQSMVLNCL